MDWEWWRKYIINIDTIVTIIVIIIFLYFVLTSKRKGKKGIVDISKKFQRLTLKKPRLNKYKSKKKKKKKPKIGKKHEKECKRIFQKLFGVPFKTIRPGWLKNPATGKKLELDGYNPSIKTPKGTGLAFEYDGKQHSEYNEFFHGKNPDAFEYQVKKDSLKDKRCKEKGVVLIRIPHFVEFHDLERYIKMMLSRENVNLNQNFNGISTPNKGRIYKGLYD